MTLPDPITNTNTKPKSQWGLRKIVAFNLRRVRKSYGFTQVELAENSGISSQTISNIEKGRFSATLDCVEKMARGMGLIPRRLLRELGRRPMPVRKKPKPWEKPADANYDYPDREKEVVESLDNTK